MLTIIATSLRRKFTDVGTLVNLVVMPVLLVVILGNALASTFEHDGNGAKAGSTSVVVVDRDNTASSRSLADYVQGASSVFTVTRAATVQEANDAVASGRAKVMMDIEPGFGTAVKAGRSGSVQLHAVDSNVDNLQAARVALDSWNDAARTGTAAKAAYHHGDYVQAGATGEDASEGLGGMTYYSVTMLILVLLYSIAGTMNFVQSEYEGPLGDRYLVSPMRRWALVGGEWAASVLAALVQAGVLVGCAVLFFGVDPGSHWLPALEVILLAAALFPSLGLLLGVLGRTRPWLDNLVSVAIPLLTFLGGGFVKLDMAGLQKLSPNSFFQDMLFHSLRGQMVPTGSLGSVAALTAGVLVVSVVMLSRKQVR